MSTGGGLAGRGCLVVGDDSAVARQVCAALADAGASVARADFARRPDAARDAVRRAREQLGTVDVLVSCPPSSRPASLGELAPAAFDAEIDAAFKSPFLYTQAVLPGMLERGSGRIVYVTTTLGITGRPFAAHVAAGARAVITLMRTVALEAAPAVAAHAVAAGHMEGGALMDANLRALGEDGLDPEAARKAILDGMPSGRLTEPADVAEAVVWLAGAAGPQLTGQVIPVAGGAELHT